MSGETHSRRFSRYRALRMMKTGAIIGFDANSIGSGNSNTEAQSHTELASVHPSCSQTNLNVYTEDQDNDLAHTVFAVVTPTNRDSQVEKIEVEAVRINEYEPESTHDISQRPSTCLSLCDTKASCRYDKSSNASGAALSSIMNCDLASIDASTKSIASTNRRRSTSGIRSSGMTRPATRVEVRRKGHERKASSPSPITVRSSRQSFIPTTATKSMKQHRMIVSPSEASTTSLHAITPSPSRCRRLSSSSFLFDDETIAAKLSKRSVQKEEYGVDEDNENALSLTYDVSPAAAPILNRLSLKEKKVKRLTSGAVRIKSSRKNKSLETSSSSEERFRTRTSRIPSSTPYNASRPKLPLSAPTNRSRRTALTKHTPAGSTPKYLVPKSSASTGKIVRKIKSIQPSSRLLMSTVASRSHRKTQKTKTTRTSLVEEEKIPSTIAIQNNEYEDSTKKTLHDDFDFEFDQVTSDAPLNGQHKGDGKIVILDTIVPSTFNYAATPTIHFDDDKTIDDDDDDALSVRLLDSYLDTPVNDVEEGFHEELVETFQLAGSAEEKLVDAFKNLTIKSPNAQKVLNESTDSITPQYRINKSPIASRWNLNSERDVERDIERDTCVDPVALTLLNGGDENIEYLSSKDAVPEAPTFVFSGAVSAFSTTRRD